MLATVDQDEMTLASLGLLEGRLDDIPGIAAHACRYLVKDRMDITGARWGLDGAEAVGSSRESVGSIAA